MAEFIETLAQQGVNAQQGGRFLTPGFEVNKAQRVQEIMADIGSDRPSTCIALGDALPVYQ